MSMIDIYVRDKQSGRVHRCGDDIHDMITINDDGQLCYHNLQNGDGCHTGDNIGGYEFVPNQDEYGYNCVPTSRKELEKLPSAQPTLYGYNIEHLELIARVLQKEDLPPERVVEVLTDVGRIVAIVKDEFEEALRKAVEQCMI